MIGHIKNRPNRGGFYVMVREMNVYMQSNLAPSLRVAKRFGLTIASGNRT